jgi:hypothetical protein
VVPGGATGSHPVVEGRRRLDASPPAVRALDAEIERDYSAGEVAAVKAWLVAAAARLERVTTAPSAPRTASP